MTLRAMATPMWPAWRRMCGWSTPRGRVEDADSQLSPDFAEQVRQAFANLQIALAAADAQIKDVAKLTVLIVDHSQERLHILGAEVARVWGALPAPACTLIPVPRLALDAMLFEVEAVAAVAD